MKRFDEILILALKSPLYLSKRPSFFLLRSVSLFRSLETFRSSFFDALHSSFVTVALLVVLASQRRVMIIGARANSEFGKNFIPPL